MKEEETKCKATVGEILNTFADNTTAHGCGSISRSKHKLGKLVWSVIFLGCICTACQGLVAIFVTYFGYPTTDTVTLERRELEIPSVTICSLFPFTISSQMTLPVPGADTNLAKLLTLFHVYHYGTFYGEHKDEYRKHKNRINSYAALFENVEDDQKLLYTHDLSNMLEQCFFNGKPCDDSFFSEIENANYQKCFTFNGAGLNLTDMTALATDPNNGLSMVLFLDAYKANYTLPGGMIYNPENPNSGTTGIHVTIHSPQTMPFPTIEGFDVPPGYSTTIGLTPVARERLPEPYGVCTNQEYIEGTQFKYSELGCLAQCVQKEMMDQCGCITAYLPYPNDTQGMLYCGDLNLDNFLNPLGPNITLMDDDFNSLECEDRLMMLGFTDNMTERCPLCLPACNAMKYEQTIAQALWPFNYVQGNFLTNTLVYGPDNNQTRRSFKLFEDLLADWPAQMDYIINTGMVRQNFLRVNIYFKDFTVETTKQTVAYGLNNMVSDIGGTLGFYVGISVVTLCEFLNLFWMIICACLRRCKSAGARRSDNVEVIQVKEANQSTDGKTQYDIEFTKNLAHLHNDTMPRNDFSSAFKY
ncbi:unnamed protein product [Owenia fusiformis]|uniref:Uncharacterized protein n=1 Tax=Owenia fusiformis TaxID=6347 RepID=A0A8J1TSS5_OWEFU|nr:unnamed protein product [Owenia fusiformis]